MRYVFLLLSCIGLFTLSCSKEKIEEFTVLKDCSSTFLLGENISYYICNEDKLNNYNNGDKISVVLKPLSCKYAMYGCSTYYELSTDAKITRILK
jgi:hypothetical protein